MSILDYSDPTALITVVIVTRDRAPELDHTLTELQNLPERLSVVVVDNASSDDTASVVGRYAGVRLEKLAINAAGAARNLGALLARTPYVAFCDDDSWWQAGSLQKAVDLLQNHPRVGLIAARVLVGPQQRTDPVSLDMQAAPLGSAAELPGPSILGFLACSAVVRRSAFLEVGGFNDLISFGGEEKLLAIDLATAGWGLCYASQMVAFHHPSPVRDRQARRVLDLRNETLICWMRRPLPIAIQSTLALLRHARHAPVRRAGLGVVRHLGRALSRRSCIPTTLEQQLRILERSTRTTTKPTPVLVADNR